MDSWSQRDDEQKEKFETLGVNEGDSIDAKKVPGENFAKRRM